MLGVITMPILLVMLAAYATVGARYLASVPSPIGNSDRLLRSEANLVYPASWGQLLSPCCLNC